MDNIKKPDLSIDEVGGLLQIIVRSKIDNIKEASSGKIKRVYFFNFQNKEYVICFAKDNTEFEVESYLQDRFDKAKIPSPKVLNKGCYKDYYYAISEKLYGIPICDLDKEEVESSLPSIMDTLKNIHSIDISSTLGYGWLNSNKNGQFKTFEEFLRHFFSKEIQGFWKDWYELFEKSFLDYEVFMELYRKMIKLAPYCEGKRYLVHSDFHYNNVLVSNSKVTGVIDWGGVSYLDYFFDISKIVLEFSEHDLFNRFCEFYKQNDFDVSHARERFLCATICHSLDGMRFYAKLGKEDVYKNILKNVLALIDIYQE
ncbi:phosphotransferase family protein [Clostridium manihotivorum]|uniref:Aminoglycoside phosphotransferase family protein n=1 Tax=Clostridium manihotivorum TaxID=2320868 RepID=A0A410DW18_9CLOT|nr:phosphotransferase [Clostridium manihotivorum]QAA33463.1 aminoglycoside phosphotransferase family protein [Clostridium manihotivorum]